MSDGGSGPIAATAAAAAAAGRYRPMSEINVTPLVDVMLVLLVVFMVAAPLLTVGVPVDLPQTQAPPINEPKEPLVITINREGAIFIQETERADRFAGAAAAGDHRRQSRRACSMSAATRRSITAGCSRS